jgi:hypothetical protein
VLSVFERLSKLTLPVQIVSADSLGLCAALFRSRTELAAENLSLRKQLALFQEREKKAIRTTAADRFVVGPQFTHTKSAPVAKNEYAVLILCLSTSLF